MTILLHICCAPCATACVERLCSDGYTVMGFFYNPNIQPIAEYNKRCEDTLRLSNLMGFKLYTGDYDNEKWLEEVMGLESEPEGGKRCEVCYRFRLKRTASLANKYDIGGFTTTLSVSPHKPYGKIRLIGEEIAKEYQLNFLTYDFKKKEGYKRSIELSKGFKLYRQNYCGCLFSKGNRQQTEEKWGKGEER